MYKNTHTHAHAHRARSNIDVLSLVHIMSTIFTFPTTNCFDAAITAGEKAEIAHDFFTMKFNLLLNVIFETRLYAYITDMQ